MKQTLILGNIITMDEKRSFAKAALVKNGVFAYIGSAEEAKELAGEGVQVLDYGDNYIYPGFLESHSHGHLAGDRFIGQANLMEGGALTDYNRYREIIKKFIAKNPQRQFYLAAGWVENEEHVTKAYLDEICSDKPLFLHTGGGHSMLLNTKALQWAGIDAEYAKKYGYDLVHVDENGEPDGYICEGPVFEIVPKLPVTLEDAKDFLLAWQDFALSSGFTAVCDAGAEVICHHSPRAYYELEQEGKLKMRTYAYMYVTDNSDPKAEIARIAAQRAELSGEYFHIIGAKAFLDGVTEAHTGWQNQDYLDTPGYHGNERFNDHDKMVQLIVEADKEGMSVHVHSEGGGATHFMLGCIEDAEKITGNKDQRNVLAHLHFVTDEDVRRMAATGSVPAVAPLWTPEITGGPYDQEVSYVGKELAEQAYPIKSFYDAGANVVFHSDYPVSPMMNVKYSIYTAEKRTYPHELYGDLCKPRNTKEAITREQSLRAMTINVARQWHQEHRMGSIEFGKIANMTVFDCDFLHDDIEKVAKANIIATIVDGEEVFKASCK